MRIDLNQVRDTEGSIGTSSMGSSYLLTLIMLMLSNCSCLIGGFGALFGRYLYVDMLEDG